MNGKDRKALGLLYTKYRRYLVRLIAMSIDSVADAEDLAQNVFVRLWETKARYEMTSPAKAYLVTVARRLVAEHLRKRKRHPQRVSLDSTVKVVDDRSIQKDQDSAGQVLQHQFQEIIDAMAVQLSPKAHKAITLRFVKGLSVREAARKTGCSVKAFYSRQERALKALKQMIEEKENR